MQIRFLYPLTVFLLMVISQAAFAVSGEDAKPSHTYKLDGALKNKFEYATEIGTSRFTVRNSCVGITGDIRWSLRLPRAGGVERRGSIQAVRP